MSEVTRARLLGVGVDIAKPVIQVHGVGTAGRVLLGRSLKRDQFLACCAWLPPGCVVALEARSGAHVGVVR